MHNFQDATSEYIYLGSFALQNERSYWIKKETNLSSQQLERLNIDRADISLFYLFKPEWGDLVGRM